MMHHFFSSRCAKIYCKTYLLLQNPGCSPATFTHQKFAKKLVLFVFLFQPNASGCNSSPVVFSKKKMNSSTKVRGPKKSKNTATSSPDRAYVRGYNRFRTRTAAN